MGGPGSGNRSWRFNTKTVVEDCLSIDANRWTREGILKAGVHTTGSWRWTYRSGSSFSVNYGVNTLDLNHPFVRLWYSWTWAGMKDPQTEDYTVRLTITLPHLGGVRWWFVCPLVREGRPCLRRVGKLHLPPRGRYFGCRHCYDLTYTSCRESHKFDGLYRFMAGNMGVDYASIKQALEQLGKGL
jgi:hypothetical protein